jgi:putative transposase
LSAAADLSRSGKNFANAVQPGCGEHVRVEVIERRSKTFEHLPKRWIVFRRLSRDYEVYSEVSEAMIYGSLIRLMVRRLAA